MNILTGLVLQRSAAACFERCDDKAGNFSEVPLGQFSKDAMDINNHHSPYVERSIIDGELTIYNAAERKLLLLEKIASADEVELDLSHVSEIDSAGVQLLMLAKQETLRRNKTLRLISHSRAVLEIFELYNLAAFFGDPLLISHSGKDEADHRGTL